MEKYDQIATDVLEKVGGRENVTFATYCVTRLRLNVRDKGVIDLDVIKGIPGVLGAQWSGEQLQVIIGNTINEVYDAFVRIGGFEQQEAVDENLDAEKAPFTIAGFFNGLSTCHIISREVEISFVTICRKNFTSKIFMSVKIFSGLQPVNSVATPIAETFRNVRLFKLNAPLKFSRPPQPLEL